MKWRNCKLGDVLTLKRGYDLPQQNREEGDVAVVTSSGITGFHSEAKATAPGVITGRYGTLGEVFYLEQDYWPHNTTLYVVDFKKTDPRFAAYFLRHILKSYQSDKAAVPGVDRKVLHDIDVRVPIDVGVQQKIAKILAAYDDLIENNKRRMVLLEEAARSIYEEWFVRLRFPGHKDTPIMNGVPEGWERVRFPEVVDFLEGPGLLNRQYRDAGIPFLNIRTIKDDEIDFSKVQYLEKSEVERRYSHFLLAKDDHVVSSSGTLGRLVTIREGHLPLMLNTSLIRMRPKPRMTKWFLKTYLKYGDYLDQVLSMATGAAQLNYGPMHLKRLKIVIPSLPVLQLFERKATVLYKQVKTLAEMNQRLRPARDLLLPRLMNGEIPV